ncbi:MAG: hypothetical protein GWQ08_03340 [Verrucomicrobiaceae bacterium]|nr:hypothetical protein [Verrucomicrobiaceae bacterium]
MMNVDRLILCGIGILTVCRWFLGTSIELTGEEALLWMESQRLDWFFTDHGPLEPMLIRLSTIVLGDTLLGVRCWNPLLILLATWLLYLLARSVFHQVVARWSVVVFQLCPIVNVAGVSAIDLALALFLWLAGIWGLWCGLHRVHRWHWAWWGAGLAFGCLGTLSLPVAVASLLSVSVSLLVLQRWESQWWRPGIWILIVLGLLVPFAFMMASGHGLLSLRFFTKSIGLHAVVAAGDVLAWAWWSGPVLAAGMVWALLRWRLWKREHGTALLFIAGGGVLLLGAVWGLLSGSSSLIWLVGAMPCFAALVSVWLSADLSLDMKGRWRLWALASPGGLALLGVNTANVRTLGWAWPRFLDTPRLAEGWTQTAQSIEAMLVAGLDQHPQGLFLVAESPASAALLEFYLPEEAPVYRVSEASPRVHLVESAGWESVYDLWPNYSHAQSGTVQGSPFAGYSALYLAKGKGEPIDTLPGNFINAFRALDFAAVLEVKRRRRELQGWTLYHAYQYRGLPL